MFLSFVTRHSDYVSFPNQSHLPERGKKVEERKPSIRGEEENQKVRDGSSMALTNTNTEEPMRKTTQSKHVLWITLLLGSLVVGCLAVGVTEAGELNFLNRDIVLLDCVENANVFVVENISSTRDVGINQGLDCAAAIKKLFATGFVLGQGAGGVTSGPPTSLNHFLMLFVFNSNALIKPTLEKTTPSGPILNRNEPLTPIFTTPEPLTPILQRRNP